MEIKYCLNCKDKYSPLDNNEVISLIKFNNSYYNL